MLVETPMELWSFTSHPLGVDSQDPIPSQGTCAPLFRSQAPNLHNITQQCNCEPQIDTLNFHDNSACHFSLQIWLKQMFQSGQSNKVRRWPLCLRHLRPGCTSVGRRNRCNKLRRSLQTCSSPGRGSFTVPHSPASPAYPAHVHPLSY